MRERSLGNPCAHDRIFHECRLGHKDIDDTGATALVEALKSNDSLLALK